MPLTSTVVAQRQPMLAQPFKAGSWRRVTSTVVAQRQPILAQPFKAALLGFLRVAIAGVAGCGCRRRIFGGMSQVFKCTLTVGRRLRRLSELGETEWGSAGAQPNEGNPGLGCAKVHPAAGRGYFASGCFLKRPLDTCVMPPKNPAAQAAPA